MFRTLIAILAFTSFSAQAQYSKVVLDDRPIPAPIAKDPDVVKHLDADPLVKHLNTSEKDFLYWTNYSRINPRRFWDSAVAPILSIYPNLKGSFANSLKETLYKTEPLPLFTIHYQLQILAKKHAVELGKNGFKLSHTSPSGTTFQQRMNAAGIESCAGENLTLGQTNPLMQLVLLYLDIGVNSLGHRKNLLNPSFTQIGIGSYTQKEQLLLVQDFGCKQPS